MTDSRTASGTLVGAATSGRASLSLLRLVVQGSFVVASLLNPRQANGKAFEISASTGTGRYQPARFHRAAFLKRVQERRKGTKAAEDAKAVRRLLKAILA